MTGDELVDAVKVKLVVELGLDGLTDYAVRSVVMITTEVLDERGLLLDG